MGSQFLDAVSGLRSVGPPTLNWLYLVENVVIIILVIFYFFYFNRFLGLLAAWVLRLFLWKTQNAYFECAGMQISLLGGRIGFSDFRYISRNQNLRIVQGEIIWRYWKFKVRSEEDKPREAKLPCRVTVQMAGAEWFLYNRTPSYDAILEALGLSEQLQPEESTHKEKTGSAEDSSGRPDSISPDLDGPRSSDDDHSKSGVNTGYSKQTSSTKAPKTETISDPSDLGVNGNILDSNAEDECERGSRSTKSRWAAAFLNKAKINTSSRKEGQRSNRSHAATTSPSANTKATTDWLREALPIDFRCKTGSIIMGNASTPTILIAGFQRVEGSYAAVKSRSQFDAYKQVYKLVFTEPKIVFRSNPDFEGSLAGRGADVTAKLKCNPDFDEALFRSKAAVLGTQLKFRQLLRDALIASSPIRRSFFDRLFRRPVRTSRLSSTAPTPDCTQDPGQKDHWQGLPRYQPSEKDMDDTSVRTLPYRAEYAKVTTLLATPELKLTYYADTAGKVPDVPKLVTGLSGLETVDIGNGDLSPEWGVDAIIKGGTLTYGPWADRQRTQLQAAFTPALFFNAKPTPKLKPGDERMHAALKIFIEFSETTTFRIPTREPSKDWKYDPLEQQENVAPASVIRPYGWLDIMLGSHSSMSYVLPMVATESGYDTLVEIHVDEMSISSSVNYATFLHAEACRIHCGLPAPLRWDDLRTWAITVSMSKADICLLRDHVTLFTDVAKDWISGPPMPGEYDQFVPYIYTFQLAMTDYNLRLYVNDQNIINNPSAMEDNSFLVVSGPRMIANTLVPSDRYRMTSSEIKFRVEMGDLALSMSLPDWNTHSAFLTERSRTFATTSELNIDGSYRFYAKVEADNVEKLAIAIDCRDVNLKMLGWMIRHMFNLRDNYFGTFTHFVTLEEYRHRRERNIQGDPLELKYRPGMTDIFEVDVTLSLRNGLMLLPQEIFDCHSAVVFAMPHMQVDLRNHDFFMEMALNIEPFRILESGDSVALLKRDFASILEESGAIFVQGFEVVANRLFGPQPRTATYMCIWSLYMGSIVGNIAPSFLIAFSRVASSVAMGFSDKDNALPADFSIALDPDATFLSIDIDSIDLAINGQRSASQVSLPQGMKIRFDDLSCANFAKHINIDVPSLQIRLLAPLFGRSAPWMEVASVDTVINVAIGLSDDGWEKHAEAQLEFIAAQDAITRRCPFIYSKVSSQSQRLGDLFLLGLDSPCVELGLYGYGNGKMTAGDPQMLGVISNEGSDVDSESDNDSVEVDSDTTSVSYGIDDPSFTTLPRPLSADDRFSAYGNILRLCKRVTGRGLIDRATFTRMPIAGDTSAHLHEHRSSPADKTLLSRLSQLPSASYVRPLSRTGIDVELLGPLRIILTPVAIQVVADISECLPIDIDLEKQLDRLFEDYVEGKYSTPTTRFSQMHFNCQIPLIDIEWVQNILRPEETISLKQIDNSTGDENGSTILCSTRLKITKTNLSWGQCVDLFGGQEQAEPSRPSVYSEVSLNATIDSVELHVFHPHEASLAQSTRKHHVLPPKKGRRQATALDLYVGNLSARFECSENCSRLSAQGGNAQLDFVDEAAELLIGSIWSWRVIGDLARSMAKRASQQQEFACRLVWSILDVSEKQSVKSFPTFLNRVSYLIGSSANLRSDDGWKNLHRMRHVLRLNTAAVEESLFEARVWPAPHQLWENVVSHLSQRQTWDVDLDEVEHDLLFRRLFGELDIDEGSETDIRRLWETPTSIQIEGGRFEANFFKGHLSDNKLIVGPLNAFLISSYNDVEKPQIQISGRITLASIEGHVDTGLLLLVRHIINVRRIFERKIQIFVRDLAQPVGWNDAEVAKLSDVANTSKLVSLPNVLVDISFAVEKLVVTARADSVKITADLIGLIVALSATSMLQDNLLGFGPANERQTSVDFAVTLRETSIAARETTSTRDDILLSVGVEQASLITSACVSHTLDGQRLGTGKQSLNCIFAVKAIRSRIPRDALRVYEFVEKYRSESLPTYDTLLAELKQGLDDVQASAIEVTAPVAQDSFIDKFVQKAKPDFQMILSLITLDLQAVRTLKMGYSIYKTSVAISPIEEQDSLGTGNCLRFGFEIGSQTIRFIPVTTEEELSEVYLKTAFEIPTLRAQAITRALPFRKVTILSTVEPIKLAITAAVIDNVLSVQSRFGKDIDELLRLVRSRKAAEKPQSTTLDSITSSKDEKRHSLAWDAKIAMKGLTVGVEGPQATQWLEAELLEAWAGSSIDSVQSLHWRASVQDLGLSLAQRTSFEPSKIENDRRYRLAFFRLDLSASNAVISLPHLPAASSTMHESDATPHLHIRLPRIHAVMQTSAIEALGDLIEHYEQEIDLRRTLRQQEMDAIRDRVVQQFDSTENPGASSGPSWLSTCILSVEAHQIGIAIPLSDEDVPAATPNRSRRAGSSQSRRAFLMTLPSVAFATQRGSAGYARVEKFALQFVPQFDQGRREDFDGATHLALNRILFPDMQSTLRAPKSGPMIINSKVSGMEIDLEPTIVSYTFALIDIYHLSHNRFSKYAPVGVAGEILQPDVEKSPKPLSRSCRGQKAPEGHQMTLEMTFQFESGVIRMRSKKLAWTCDRAMPSSASRFMQEYRSHRRGHSLTESNSLKTSAKKNQENDTVADEFRLPEVSVWAIYQEAFTTLDPMQVHIDISIHSSTNTLYPTLIPFISEVCSQLKSRVVKEDNIPPTAEATALKTSSSLLNPEVAPSGNLSRCNLGVSLKVDQSRLEISCLPAAEVTARLTWESGGFHFAMSPDTKAVEFAFRVAGVGAGLRHSFSPEDCLSAELKGIAASATFQEDVLSIVVHFPDIVAEMNFRHLQDWLCLQAVWLDRMDLEPSNQLLAGETAQTVPMEMQGQLLTMTIIVMVSVQQLRLSYDLGQNIGRTIFDAEDINLRLRVVPNETRSLTASIAQVNIISEGRVSGTFALSDLLFDTTLREEGYEKHNFDFDLLRIRMCLGQAKAKVDYDFYRILVLECDPIAILVQDDWSQVSSKQAELALSFNVNMGAISLIATTATVPTLVSIGQRIKSLLEEKAIQADSTIANAGLPPRPSSVRKGTNTIAAVASQLAPRMSDGGFPIRITNKLEMQVERIRIGVFPDHFNDGEVFRVDAGNSIRARLIRGVDRDGVVHRDLSLYLGFFSIRKINHRKLTPATETDYTLKEWYDLFHNSTERNIFRVPTTEVLMISEQEEGSNRLTHKFSMTFDGQVDVALNYALLRNLGSLATAYQSQLERARIPRRAFGSPGQGTSSGAATPVFRSNLDSKPLFDLPSPSEKEREGRTIRGDTVPSFDAEIVKMKLKPLAQNGQVKELEFEAIEVNIHQPKLNLLGEATPPLEWLGLQRARFPGWVHTGVTTTLEELLLVLSASYQKQLSRQKVKNLPVSGGRQSDLTSPGGGSPI